MYTIDASVYVSALNRHEADSATSMRFLEFVRHRQELVFSPVLLRVEVAAAVARRLVDPERAVELAMALGDLPRQTLVPLEGTLIDRAVSLAAIARLRGADAVYAAVAQEYGTTLVTLDGQQLERLTNLIPTFRPVDLLEG